MKIEMEVIVEETSDNPTPVVPREEPKEKETKVRRVSSGTSHDRDKMNGAVRKTGVFAPPLNQAQLQSPIILDPSSLDGRIVNSGDRKISLPNEPPRKGSLSDHRRFSVNDRKISLGQSGLPGSHPASRKVSPASRRMSRADSTMSGRKIGVLQRTLTQMTLSQLEIGSIKDKEGSVFDEFVSKKTPQILAALAATIGAFGMGTVMAWSSPAGPQLQASHKLGHPETSTVAWVASFVPLAAVFAGPPTGQCIEKIGRRPTMIALSAPFVLGWLLIAFAENIPMMLVGRALTGFCAGAFSLTAPVFISETAEASIRGTLGSGFQLMVTLGILFSYVVGAFVSWQWLAIISAFVPLVMLILMIYVPASPRYLLSKGEVAEASKALAWFRGAESSDLVNVELQLIQQSLDEAKAKKTTVRDFFKVEILKPISISMGLMFFQSFSGTDAVTFYTVDIFEETGSSMNGNTATIIVGAIQCFATFMSLLLVDKAGRRMLLLASDAVMAIALAGLGTYFFLEQEARDTFSVLPIISVCLFVTAYSIGFGPVPWMMMGELLPNHVIGVASAISTSFNWICTFIVIQFFVTLKDAIGPSWSYMLFAGCCVCGIFFVFFFVPETKGKSLDEIQELFAPKQKKVKPPSAPPSRRVSKTTVDSYFFA